MNQKKISRITRKGRHIYTIEGVAKEFVGFTSMLNMIHKPWLLNWKVNNPDWEQKMKYAQKVGNIAHTYAEVRGIDGIMYSNVKSIKDTGERNRQLQNIMFMDAFLEGKRRTNIHMRNAMGAFDKWADEYEPLFLATEVRLIDVNSGFGCTVDAIVLIGSTIHVVDYKTSASISKENIMQIVMYTDVVMRNLAGGKRCIPTIVRLQKKNGRMHMNTFEDKFMEYKEMGHDLVKFYNAYNTRGLYGKN